MSKLWAVLQGWSVTIVASCLTYFRWKTEHNFWRWSRLITDRPQFLLPTALVSILEEQPIYTSFESFVWTLFLSDVHLVMRKKIKRVLQESLNADFDLITRRLTTGSPILVRLYHQNRFALRSAKLKFYIEVYYEYLTNAGVRECCENMIIDARPNFYSKFKEIIAICVTHTFRDCRIVAPEAGNYVNVIFRQPTNGLDPIVMQLDYRFKSRYHIDRLFLLYSKIRPILFKTVCGFVMFYFEESYARIGQTCPDSQFLNLLVVTYFTQMRLIPSILDLVGLQRKLHAYGDYEWQLINNLSFSPFTSNHLLIIYDPEIMASVDQQLNDVKAFEIIPAFFSWLRIIDWSTEFIKPLTGRVYCKINQSDMTSIPNVNIGNHIAMEDPFAPHLNVVSGNSWTMLGHFLQVIDQYSYTDFFSNNYDGLKNFINE